MYGFDEAVKNTFLRYKEKIRNKIDLPMLRRIVPTGAVIKDVRTEIYDKITFGRQLGSYQLLVGIPMKLELNKSFDILVTDHGHRSITGLPLPMDLNRMPLKIIQVLPGVGKNRWQR